MGKPADLLLFVAHCDDAELWAGGTIVRFVEAGKRVVLAIAHHDSVRRVEAEAGAAILGCEVCFRELQMDMTVWVAACLRRSCPVVLLTHPINDPHFEHRELSDAVCRALTKCDAREEYPARWYYFDTYYSTNSREFPLLIDITECFHRKCSALNCHLSQKPADLIQMAEEMNGLHGQRIRRKKAEAFYPYALLGRWPRLRDLP